MNKNILSIVVFALVVSFLFLMAMWMVYLRLSTPSGLSNLNSTNQIFTNFNQTITIPYATTTTVAQQRAPNYAGELGTNTSSAFINNGALWDGYLEANENITSISGEWRVSKVNSTDLSASIYQWIGFGDEPNSLIQIGTQSNANGQYLLWYEMLPDTEFTVFSISPNDSITARIDYLGAGEWKLSLTDITSNQSFTTTLSYSGRTGIAEAVLERPLWCLGRAYGCVVSSVPVFDDSVFNVSFNGQDLCSGAVFKYSEIPNTTVGPISNCDSFQIHYDKGRA